MPTLDEIVQAAEEACGEAVMRQMSNPHARDLPIRHPDTGAIMAYVPASMAAGLLPIAINGVVVSYYRDETTLGVSLFPLVSGTEVLGLTERPLGERWMPVFDDNGNAYGSVRLI